MVLATSNQSIFEKSHYGPLIKLKDSVRFHLYVSKGPCGDATTFGKGNTKAYPDRYVKSTFMISMKLKSKIEHILLFVAVNCGLKQKKPKVLSSWRISRVCRVAAHYTMFVSTSHLHRK